MPAAAGRMVQMVVDDHGYCFGEEMKALHKGGDGLFTMDELIQDVPATIMSEAARVAPPYEKAG